MITIAVVRDLKSSHQMNEIASNTYAKNEMTKNSQFHRKQVNSDSRRAVLCVAFGLFFPVGGHDFSTLKAIVSANLLF